ncbi:MAG: DUF362 domain-containing protein, partial [Acidobacteriaceae bacterium]|nr:DUF362 domain-containing protein [Acidobacteriaceae bacterium]
MSKVPLTRRYFFFGALACITSCSKRNQSRPLVSVVRAASYSSDLESLIRRILTEHRVPIAGKKILLKPNLVEFDSHAPINTHPVFVAAVAAAFRALGASEVRIAEGPGHRRTT